jgi:hypothetical protein
MTARRSSRFASENRSEFALSRLESRLMLSATPENVLSIADRQALLAAWSGPNKAQLASDLSAGNYSGFDTDLLSYMQSRTDASFYFKPGDVNNDLSFIQSEIGTSNITSAADNIVAHEFPSSPNATDSNSTQLPAGDVNWVPDSGSNFSYSLNRQAFWVPLAEAYRLTGNTAYSTELTNELASWSSQSPALANANSWPSAGPNWQLLDTSIRATNWLWTYSLMVGTSGWTPEANTLFLYKMEQTGDFLRNATPIEIDDNRAVLQYSGLVGISDLFPEFSNAANWSSYGHSQLFAAMNAQIYPDGSEREQSPGYTEVVLNSLLDTDLLDQDNNYTWPSAQTQLLNSAVTSFEQLLSPNGNTTAMGDTYRESAAPIWLGADLILNTDAYPAARARASDVLMFGASTAGNYLSNPVTPALPDRGLAYAEPDAGDYVFRSGSDSNAQQVTFNAGEKGGNHGHFDLLNFELFGYGKPLISNPGMVSEDASSARAYAISTPAQNSISVDGLNTGDLEGMNNPAIQVNQWDPESDSVQVTATHEGYGYLPGSPELTRSIWYGYGNTMLVVDWAVASASHTYTVGFNLPGAAAMNGDDSIQSTNGGGDVKITPLLTSGKSFNAVNSFVSNTASPDESPAVHYSESQQGNFSAFANLITTYNGSTPPDVTATVLNTPSVGGAITIALTENGVTRDITFTPPMPTIPNHNGTVAGTQASLAYGSNGTLYMAYYSPTDGHLYYTTRVASGLWSPVQIVDNSANVGQMPSIALDSNNNPGIAYYDAANGDLKYAYLDPTANSWQVQTVDSHGTVGEYPSLAFSRHNGPAISYYDVSHHALKLAIQGGSAWQIQTVDHSGKVGTYTKLSLDPSRPTASKWAISYDDASNGTVRFAIQERSAWTIYTVGTGSGPSSLAFDGSNLPALAFYDRKDNSVDIARYSVHSQSFSASPITSSKSGQNPNLLFTKKGVATVFYDGAASRVIESVQSGGGWSAKKLGNGGGTLDVLPIGKLFAYTESSSSDLTSVLFT